MVEDMRHMGFCIAANILSFPPSSPTFSPLLLPALPALPPLFLLPPFPTTAGLGLSPLQLFFPCFTCTFVRTLRFIIPRL